MCNKCLLEILKHKVCQKRDGEKEEGGRWEGVKRGREEMRREELDTKHILPNRVLNKLDINFFMSRVMVNFDCQTHSG